MAVYTTRDIKDLFNHNKASESEVDAFLITRIGQYASPNILFEEDELEYYYAIDIEDLADKDVEQDIINKMVEGGWQLAKNKQQLIKKC